jgi:hypothetical protein
MPRPATGLVDIDVVFVRDVRSEHIENVDLGGRRGSGVIVALLVGSQRLLVGVGASVGTRDARHSRIGEDDRAVAGQDVAAVQALAEQQGVFIREVVVGGV